MNGCSEDPLLLMDPKTPNLLTKPPRKKVYIVYYLSRASHIDQPHLIEAHLPLSQDAIRLKDFKRWLSNLRGKALPNSFAWAYKRIYRNSYIWHDLSDNDFIQPLCKNEYVLIGSEIQDKCRCGFVKESSYNCKQLKDQEEEEEEEGGGAGLLISTTYNQQKESQDVKKGLMGSRDECGVYRARTPPLTNDQGTDAATQTGESKRCSTEEMYRPSLMLPNIQSSCKLSTLPSPPPIASLPPINLRAALESPDSVASSNAQKCYMKPKAKHPSSQVFKQLLSCGSVDMDIDESSIFNLKSLNMTPITPQSQRSYKAIWSSSPSMKDGNSISGLSDQSMLLRKALVSKYIDSPNRTDENIAAKDMKEDSHGCHRRSLQFDYGKRMPDTTMANSPRISTSDNFTPSWRERLWSPKKDIKHGGKHEKRHQ